MKIPRKTLTTAALLATTMTVVTGANSAGTASSADILTPFGCDSDPAVECDTIGTSTLYRTRDGVGAWAVIEDGSVAPNTPFTFWIVAFNNASACAAFPHGACGAGDLGNPDVKASIQWAGGNYSNLEGGLQLQAFVPNSAMDRFTIFGPGVINGQHAEIHFIYRPHTRIEGEEWAAINTPGGSGPLPDIASSVHLRSSQ